MLSICFYDNISENKIVRYITIYDIINDVVVHEEYIDTHNKVLFRQTIFMLAIKYNISRIKYSNTGIGIIYDELLKDMFLDDCKLIKKVTLSTNTIHDVLATHMEYFDNERIEMRINGKLSYNTKGLSDIELKEYNTLLVVLG